MFKYFLVINILTLPFDSSNINLEEKNKNKTWSQTLVLQNYSTQSGNNKC